MFYSDDNAAQTASTGHWKTADGRVLKITDLTDDHLLNIRRYLRSRLTFKLMAIDPANDALRKILSKNIDELLGCFKVGGEILEEIGRRGIIETLVVFKVKDFQNAMRVSEQNLKRHENESKRTGRRASKTRSKCNRSRRAK